MESTAIVTNPVGKATATRVDYINYRVIKLLLLTLAASEWLKTDSNWN